MTTGIPTQTFQPGEIIFREGSDGRTAFILQDGSVEIFTERDGKRTVLTTLGAGACFGEMAPLATMQRTASAVAKTTTCAYVVDETTLHELLQQSQPVARAVVQSLIRRLQIETRRHVAGALPQNPITTMARLLVLLGNGYSDGGSTPRMGGRRQRPGEANICEIPQRLAATTASQMLGAPTYAAKALLHKMGQLNLLQIKPNNGEALVGFDLNTLVTHAQNIERAVGNLVRDGVHADIELLELDEFAGLVGADPRKVLLKISQEPELASLLVFRKSAALHFIEEHGNDYFNKTRIKRVEEFDCIDDLQFIDRETLGGVLGAMEPYAIAQLVKYAPESARERLLGCLSSRIRAAVERTVATLGEVDLVDGEQLQHQVIDAIKRAKGVTTST